MRHFLSLKDYSKEEIQEILAFACKLKAETKSKECKPYLQGKTLGMMFGASSLRARFSFEVGMYQLGGMGICLSDKDLQLHGNEELKDVARVLSSMVDMVVMGSVSHEWLLEFSQYSSVPLINGMSDLYHPVQLLADYMTILEYHKNPIIAYVGDGHHKVHSWLMLASKMGLELRVAVPRGYEPSLEILEEALGFASSSGAKIMIMHDPKDAVCDASVVATDAWGFMGQEAEQQKRLYDFQGFCVDKALMSLARKDAIFIHGLPAYRNYEVSDEVLEGEQSVVFAEAENRLHIQKGIMVWLDQKR